MNKYFSVVGFIDNDYEVLFGSFDRADCVSEIECEKSSWKDQGYKRIKIQSKTTTDVPDRSIYKNIVSNTDFSCYVDAKNDGEIFDYIADDLISNCGNDFFINDEKLLKDVNQFLVGKINIQFSNCDQVIEAIEKNDKRIKLIIDTDKNQYVYNCLVEFIDDTKLFMQFAVAGSFITHDQTSIETYVEMFNLKASK